MEYEDRIVCFLDILGFESHVYATVSPTGTDNTDKIHELSEAFLHVRDILDSSPPDMESKQVTQFSDSIVISFRVSEKSGVFWTLLEILWLQIGLLHKGMICRGAVSRGKLLHTPEYIFGPAMIESYKLESMVALYPRVILDESILLLSGSYQSPHHTQEQEEEYVRSIVAKDSDGMYFINYFEKAEHELYDQPHDYPRYLQKMSTIIQTGMMLPDPSVRIKYQWMKERYNPIVKRIKNNLSHESDPDLVAAYKALQIF